MSEFRICDEYSTLKMVILCPPRHIKIQKPINVIQAKWHEAGAGPVPELCTQEYNAFKEALTCEGISVLEIIPSEQFPLQVFTRDIGVVANKRAIIANLKFKPRIGEEKEAERKFQGRDANFVYAVEAPGVFEGGDFLQLDASMALLGLGDRTNADALKQLQAHMPNLTIHPVELPEGFLHLDVVLNIVSPEIALAYLPALSDEILSFLESRGFRIIEVSSAEQETMGTNALAIGNNKVVAAACNKEINQKMKAEGLGLIEIEMTEILKGGGGPRCMTLPVFRQAGSSTT